MTSAWAASALRPFQPMVDELRIGDQREVHVQVAETSLNRKSRAERERG